MSFAGGKLKLKGAQPGVRKKKKKAQQTEGALALQDAEPDSELKETKDGVILPQPTEGADRRTAAEKRYDESMAKRDADKTRKMALKSHRERVAEFNEKLQNLSEHHDIPKVGPG